MDLALAAVHADQLALAVADELHHAAHVLLGDVDDEILDPLDDVARGCFIRVFPAEAVEHLKLLHFALYDRAVALHDRDLLAAPDHAIVDAPDADPANVVVVLDRADADLKALVLVAMRRRDVL